MIDGLTLSIFTIEADRRPIAAVPGKKQSEAEAILNDEYLREQFRLLKSEGKPLCDDLSILRMRIARPNERALYYENAAALLTGNGQLAVLLVELDDPS